MTVGSDTRNTHDMSPNPGGTHVERAFRYRTGTKVARAAAAIVIGVAVLLVVAAVL